VSRETSADGIVCTTDGNGRICWDSTRRERVILLNDLRKYGVGLHIGQMGWTVPGSTDGYKWIDVEFDTGQRLPVLVYGLECVEPNQAEKIAGKLLEKNRNTRFDADTEVAVRCQKEWIRRSYEPYIAIDELVVQGEGSQELYAFCFPSQRELAKLKGEERFPMKIGYSANEGEGALGRIRQQIIEAAAYPERPSILLIFRTWSGRSLEMQLHRCLRLSGRAVETAMGQEWFYTTIDEILQHISECELPPKKLDKPLSGASESIEEGFAAMLGPDEVIEFGIDPNTANAVIGVKKRKKSNQEPEGDGRSPPS